MMQILEFAAWIAAGYYMLRLLCVLNHMRSGTAILYKLARLGCVFSAGALVLAPLADSTPEIYREVVVDIAYRCLLICMAISLSLDKRASLSPRAHGQQAEGKP